MWVYQKTLQHPVNIKNMDLKRKKLCTTKIATMEYGVEYIFKDLITEKYIISIIIIFWIIVM